PLAFRHHCEERNGPARVVPRRQPCGNPIMETACDTSGRPGLTSASECLSDQADAQPDERHGPDQLPETHADEADGVEQPPDADQYPDRTPEPTFRIVSLENQPGPQYNQKGRPQPERVGCVQDVQSVEREQDPD